MSEDKRKQTVLVTGAAGFIGFHLAKRLLQEGWVVVGVDNLNDYYDVGLKKARLSELTPKPNFRFFRHDLTERAALDSVFAEVRPRYVVNLAAQAGVRYSLSNPEVYAQSNLVGFLNVLETCRHHRVAHLVYASSSSVYGANSQLPFSEADRCDHPVSFYAATKRANELMASSYSHLFGLPCTGLRFFTAYGPWGRPDMALFKFTEAVLAGKSIPLFNHGEMSRDFTYIDDIVEGVARLVPLTPAVGDGFAEGLHTIYNIGNHTPTKLLDFIAVLEKALGAKAVLDLRPMQPGEVLATFADTTKLHRRTGFAPSTPLETGISRFVQWYRGFYR